MLGLPGLIGTIIDLFTVIVGFGLIVFFHELGHFLAARWAGIRVLTFAVGFGPPVFSFRKGVGLRRGTSRDEYENALRSARRGEPPAIGHTEYRLSALPFGGYVQMLGQDDLDPGAVSESPDSYQNAPIWKRMIVISAGVVMNVILAGVLFVVVFMAGLKVQPPIVGSVLPDSPAARAEPAVVAAGVGLQPGDRVLEIDGHRPRRFDSIALNVAMAEAGRPVGLLINRPGVPEAIRYTVTPVADDQTGLLHIGISPPTSTAISNPGHPETRSIFAAELDRLGLGDLQPGDRITGVEGRPAATFAAVREAFARSEGRPLKLTVERAGGSFETVARPRPEFESAEINGPHTGPISIDHLLGLVPVMRVADRGGAGQGLAHGDVFLRIGSIEFPDFASGINEIRGHSGRPIELVVLRPDGSGGVAERVIDARVSRKGLVGFLPDDTMREDTLLAMPPLALRAPGDDSPSPSPAASLFDRAGARITSVAGVAVSDFEALRAALLDATRAARETGLEEATVEITYTFPYAASSSAGAVAPETVLWTLDRHALERLDRLGWGAPLSAWMFEPVETLMKANGPAHAVSLGVAETHRVMMSVYITFLRLTQGSLHVEHIKGPVGIAHIGTLIADRGLIWLLFFLGLISVNLAVVNFLPLPIVDGGQFLMLLYEQIRGKPVPIVVQNVVMTAGMLLIVSVFLIVTFNDIKALLGG